MGNRDCKGALMTHALFLSLKNSYDIGGIDPNSVSYSLVLLCHRSQIFVCIEPGLVLRLCH